jgi:flavin reductase (DIM6/NTAB) family NADH-FMN oxidoreductase RutF
MKGEKEEVVSFIYRLLHPRNTILVTCIDKNGKPNIITLAWSMPISMKPAVVGISVAPSRYSHGLIAETKEFAINIPTRIILKQTLFCGRVSGRDVDKFKQSKLTPIPASKIKPPLIKECIAHLECKLMQQLSIGDHTLFIGEVVAASADKGIFKESFDIKKADPIYHLAGDNFMFLAKEIITP